MALFKRDFNKPGPGVPKNAPRKRGIARFFEVIGRDFSNLVKLNLLYAATLLPAQALLILSWLGLASGNSAMFFLCALLAIAASVPVGPATTAVYYIISKMLRDDPGFVWHDFKRLFKENFRTMLAPGILYAVLVGTQVFAFQYYTNLEGGMGFAMVALYLFSVLLLAMASPYFFTQAAYVDLKPAGLLKNSLLMALGYAPRSFMSALLGTGLMLLQLLFFPLLLIITLFFGYTVPCLMSLMWIWPVVDKAFGIEATLKERQKDSLQHIQTAGGPEPSPQEEAVSEEEPAPEEEPPPGDSGE